MRVGLAVGLLACLLMNPARAESDSQFRPAIEINWLRWQKLTLATYTEGTFSDQLENAAGYYVSQKLTYDALPHLQLGINGSRLETEVPDTSGGEHRSAVWRAEFDVTPQVRLGERWSIQVRNRAEFRWPEGSAAPVFRSRHRLALTYRLENAGPLTGLYSYYEYIHDWDLGRDGEHRVTPLGFEWRLFEGVKLRTGYEWRTRIAGGRWQDSHIFLAVFHVDLK